MSHLHYAIIMKILSTEALAELIERHGLDNYLNDLVDFLADDFSRWDKFIKVPRPSMKTKNGFIELMPIHDGAQHSYKYVTCYPDNPSKGKQTVVAVGQLSSTQTGYPVLISEMTVTTALRTAATAALATKLMAREDSHVLALIGTGAQSEFQVKAAKIARDITQVRYFDIDPAAMDKFEANLKDETYQLVRCDSAKEALEGADIVTVCTACMGHAEVIKNDWVRPGMHINGLGGDCPGKTELELSILSRSRIVTDYLDQAVSEGEVQRYEESEARQRVSELYELVNDTKKGRENEEEITLFDSVGMALEDFSALRLNHELAKKYNAGKDYNLVPSLENPKDLISVLIDK